MRRAIIMVESIGLIGKCEDPLIAKEIELFLKRLKGFKLIYFTHSSNHKLYIVNSDRLNKLESGGDAQNE